MHLSGCKGASALRAECSVMLTVSEAQDVSRTLSERDASLSRQLLPLQMRSTDASRQIKTIPRSFFWNLAIESWDAVTSEGVCSIACLIFVPNRIHFIALQSFAYRKSRTH